MWRPTRRPRGPARSCNGTSGSVPRCSCPGARWPAAPSGRSASRRRGMSMKRTTITVSVGAALVTAAIAHGQPLPDVPIPPDNAGSGSGSAQPPPPQPQQGGTETPPPPPPNTPTDPYAPLPPPKPRKPLPPLYMPEVLTTPTGFLLPAAVLYSKTSIDTGGGVTSDTRVGLGDVAEFGVATTDAVRERTDENDTDVSRI